MQPFLFVRVLSIAWMVLITSRLCFAQGQRSYPPLLSPPLAADQAPAAEAAQAASSDGETLIVEHTKPSVLADAIRSPGGTPLTTLRDAPLSPLARTIRTRAMMQKAAIDAEQTAFRELITGRSSPITIAPSLTLTPVRNVLNASILTGAAPGSYEKLRALGFNVSRARTVRANLAESVSRIGADQVWTQLTDGAGRPITGRGVTVGVIDTGIDYKHPDFGSCSRQQFLEQGCLKVRGGYDFSANDADPVDEHFHGTHVAGIIAADGALRGVAPDSSLYALRVLNRYGSGSTADVVRAIEWATDPNGDGDPSDHLDVINLSLGAEGGTATDPDSLAVDAASNAGVVVVVAAGNSGPGASTIGSPGAARNAITVGASAKDDTLADFSSRGPVKDGATVIAKPDLVAPGVAICAAKLTSLNASTCTDSNHVLLSGTSMATPHVAGIAALMKQANPSLLPYKVKTILRSTSIPLTSSGVLLDRYAQGAGRVDAKAAVQQALAGAPEIVAYIATSGEVSDSITPIIGDAGGYRFERFDLFLISDATGASTLVASSTTPVSGGTLGSINAAALPSGAYTLRLEVRANGTLARDTSAISVQHLAITAPRSPSSASSIDPVIYGAANSIPITGSITGEGLSGFTLSICWSFSDAANCSSSAIAPAISNGTQVRNGLLGTLALDAVPVLRRGVYQLTLKATYSSRKPETITEKFYIDPHLVKGFHPSNLCGVSQPCSNFGPQPLTADITGDGAAETIFTLPHQIHVVDKTGANLPGWPLSVTEDLLTPPSIGDLDNDGISEVVVQGYQFLDASTVATATYAFRADGTLMAGWPYKTQGLYIDLQRYVGDFVTIADITGDGFREVIVSPTEVLDRTGSLLTGWPTQLADLPASDYPMFGGMVVADLNGDSRNELIWSSTNWSHWSTSGVEDSVLVVQSSDGSVVSKTPISALMPTGPIAADVDGNGKADVITFQRSNTTATTSVSARRLDGSLISGWPVRVPNEVIGDVAFAASIVAGDINNDGRAEVVFQSDVNTTIIRYQNGAPVAVLPDNPSLSGFGSLAIANIDTDPSPEILFVSRYSPLPFSSASASDPRTPLLMLVALTSDLSLQAGFPILVPRSPSPSYQLAVADIDGDREQEIVYPGMSSLLAFRTGGCANSREPWPVERGDSQRSAALLSEPMCSGGTNMIEVCNKHSDTDFIDDCQDLCATTERLSPHRVCGCALGEDDWDGDGVLTCLDGCPDDPEKTEPGPCGCFYPETDFNRNRVIDCLEDPSITQNLPTPRPSQPPKIVRRSARSITVSVPLSASGDAAKPRVDVCIKPIGSKPTCRRPRSGNVTFRLQRAAYSLYYTWKYQGRSSYRSPRLKIVGGQTRSKRKTNKR